MIRDTKGINKRSYILVDPVQQSSDQVSDSLLNGFVDVASSDHVLVHVEFPKGVQLAH